MTTSYTPDEFKKLKNSEMKAELAKVSLKTGGNKPDLVQRFMTWYAPENRSSDATKISKTSVSSTRQREKSVVSRPSDPDLLSLGDSTKEPFTTETSDNLNLSKTFPLLRRLVTKTDVRVSEITATCLKLLKYTPSKNYRQKSTSEDLSEALRPLRVFVDAFSNSLAQVVVTPDAGENEQTLRVYITENIPKIDAPRELVPFFRSWNIATVELYMQAGVDQLEQQDADETPGVLSGDISEGLSNELDIINNALNHRLARWAASLPERRVQDQLWPTTFNMSNRTAIRKYIQQYIKDNALAEKEVSEADIRTVVRNVTQDDKFPVPVAKSDAVIQAAFKEIRYRKRNQSLAAAKPSTATASRTSLLSKQPPGRNKNGYENEEGTDDDDEERGATQMHTVQERTWKRARRSIPDDLTDDEEQDTHGHNDDGNDERETLRTLTADDENDKEEYGNYERRDLKRARKRRATTKKILNEAS